MSRRSVRTRSLGHHSPAACSVRARVELEDLAASRLSYELAPQCNERLLSQEDRFYIGEEYKRQARSTRSAARTARGRGGARPHRTDRCWR